MQCRLAAATTGMWATGISGRCPGDAGHFLEGNWGVDGREGKQQGDEHAHGPTAATLEQVIGIHLDSPSVQMTQGDKNACIETNTGIVHTESGFDGYGNQCLWLTGCCATFCQRLSCP